MGSIEDIYHKYKKDVNNFLIYYMNTLDVDDVLQETFIKALSALNKNTTVNNMRSWLISIARHAAIDYLRKQKKNQMKLIAYKDESIYQEQLSLEEAFQASERERALLQSVSQLKNTYQEVVILHGIKQFSISETADILNWNENKVRVTYHRALKKLSQLIEQGGVIDDFK